MSRYLWEGAEPGRRQWLPSLRGVGASMVAPSPWTRTQSLSAGKGVLAFGRAFQLRPLGCGVRMHVAAFPTCSSGVGCSVWPSRILLLEEASHETLVSIRTLLFYLTLNSSRFPLPWSARGPSSLPGRTEEIQCKDVSTLVPRPQK